MKKRFFGLLFTLMFCVVALLLTVSAEESLPATCEHCGKAVTWTPLTETELTSSTTLSSGHYYLAFNIITTFPNLPHRLDYLPHR